VSGVKIFETPQGVAGNKKNTGLLGLAICCDLSFSHECHELAEQSQP